MTATGDRRRMEACYGPLPSLVGGLGFLLDIQDLSAQEVLIGSFADDATALARDLAEVGKDLRRAVVKMNRAKDTKQSAALSWPPTGSTIWAWTPSPALQPLGHGRSTDHVQPGATRASRDARATRRGVRLSCAADSPLAWSRLWQERRELILQELPQVSLGELAELPGKPRLGLAGEQPPLVLPVGPAPPERQ